MLTTGSSIKNVVPQLEQIGVKLDLYLDCDGEAIYHFPEDQISLVASILKPQTKGKSINPKSVKSSRNLKKELDKKQAKINK